jgi:adenylate cyclase
MKTVLAYMTKFRVLHAIVFINAVSLVLSATIIIVAMWVSSEKNARELSEELIVEIRSSISNRLMNYFNPVMDINSRTSFLIRNYFSDPLYNTENENKLWAFYEEVLYTTPAVKMIYYSDNAGNLMMLNRMADGTYSKRRVRNDGIHITTAWEHANPQFFNGYSNSVMSAEEGYDPRKRDWFQLAASKKNSAWTPVYLFATDHLPGFTSVIPFFDDNGTLRGVSSIDITVDELSRFLATIQPTPGTKIALIDNVQNLVALQAKSEADLNKLFTETIDENGVYFYDVRSLDMFPDLDTRYILRTALNAGEEGLQTINYENKRYCTILAPILIGNGLNLSLGIIIPEDDIIGNVRRNLLYVTIFSIAILTVIIIISSLFSNSIAKPMMVLSSEMSKIKNFELDSSVNIRTRLFELSNMRESFEGMRKGLKNFKRYVPSDLVAQLINQDIEAKIGGQRRELTIFFSDIAHFTSISEKTPPDELMRQLCIYFEKISKTILVNKGTIDKYIGDSVMAFWGAPVPAKNHAAMACRSAVRIQSILNNIFNKWQNLGIEPFYTRIGIHTGEAIVGNMGYEERLNYTVIGDSVNLASRLEGVNKVYGTKILVSQNTWKLCKNLFEFRHIDRIAVVGRHEGIEIYELYAEKNNIKESLKKLFRIYEKGLDFYFNRDWQNAYSHFCAVLKYLPSDEPSKLMQSRCLQYYKNPPSEEWNGVYTLSSK